MNVYEPLQFTWAVSYVKIIFQLGSDLGSMD